MSINIMEVAQMMQDKNALQKDWEEAIKLVNNMFQEKYVSKIQSVIQDHHSKIMKNPPREVQLMHAVKQFLPPQNRKSAEQMIDAMILTGAFKSIQSELTPQNFAQHRNMGQNRAFTQEANRGANRSPLYDEPMPRQTAPSADHSVHGDGVYDLDQACLNDKSNTGKQWPGFPGMLALLALLMPCRPFAR